jgi:hypothetical protein
LQEFPYYLFPSNSIDSTGNVTLSTADPLTNKVGTYKSLYTMQSTYCATSDAQPITVQIIDVSLTGLSATLVAPSPTPSVTTSPSITPSTAISPSITPTTTASPTATITPSPTRTPAPSGIPVSPTVTPTQTPSTTRTPSITPTITPTPTVTVTPTASSGPVEYLIDSFATGTAVQACTTGNPTVPVYALPGYTSPIVTMIFYTSPSLTTPFVGSLPGWRKLTRGAISYAAEVDTNGELINYSTCP